MKNLLLLALAAAAMAACDERKASPQPRPDYDGVKAASERSHGSLDKESGGE